MTDKTRYCELCEAAQREIAELKASAFGNIETTRKAAKFLADLENVDAEIARLKSERLQPLDEAIARVKHIAGGFEKRSYAEDMKAELRGYLQWIDIDLTEIRAKYEKE